MIDIKLLIAADKYDINDLQAVCELHMLKLLNIDNVPQVVSKTYVCSSEEYTNQIVKFIVKNWKEVQQNINYSLLEKQPSILTDALSQLTSPAKHITNNCQ